MTVRMLAHLKNGSKSCGVSWNLHVGCSTKNAKKFCFKVSGAPGHPGRPRLTKFANGWRFIVVMARRLQYADWVKEYEVPDPANLRATYRIEVEKGSSGGSPSKVGRIRKKGRLKKKSSK